MIANRLAVSKKGEAVAEGKVNIQQIRAKIIPLIERWARGEITLKDIKGYTDEELYTAASQGYFFFLQGRPKQAKVIFEGLVAIDPKNAYYYRALGVIYFQLKELEKALRQFTYAIRVSPHEMVSYVNRAEIFMALKRFDKATADINKSISLARPIVDESLKQKALAMYKMIPH